MKDLIAAAVERADVLILAMLIATALLIARIRGIWAAVMLTGIYSLLGACWMLWLDAPDVAFTEAAVGAGVATVLMLGTLSLVGSRSRPRGRRSLGAACVVTVVGGVLVYGTLDMPHYGDANAPIHLYPEVDYIERSREEIDMPNVVTAVLASYRGYDTLGETVVVFTAAVCVLMLLRGRRWRSERDGERLEPQKGEEADEC